MLQMQSQAFLPVPSIQNLNGQELNINLNNAGGMSSQENISQAKVEAQQQKLKEAQKGIEQSKNVSLPDINKGKMQGSRSDPTLLKSPGQ